MATETSDGVSEDGADATTEGVSPYVRSVTVTTLATVSGIGAGIASTLLIDGVGGPLGLVILATAILAQFPLLRAIGIDTDSFGTKDKLYIGFMSFALWFISWAIFLTTGALQ